MLPILITVLISPIVVQGRTEVEKLIPKGNYTHLDVYANALGKSHYNAWTCNYRSEPGYKCISCSDALHCYPGNLALLVQCAGLFPYCRNGYCSLWKAEGCNEEYMIAEGTHGPLRVTTTSTERTTMSPQGSTSGEMETVHDDSVVTVGVDLADSNKVEEIVTSTAKMDAV